MGEGHRFCGECGAAAGGCPSCGEPAIAGKRFCHASGFALSGAAPPPGRGRLARNAQDGREAGERAGSGAADLLGAVLQRGLVHPLSEARDPEAVRELLSRYFEVARTIIGRYGGVVEKFIRSVRSVLTTSRASRSW